MDVCKFDEGGTVPIAERSLHVLSTLKLRCRHAHHQKLLWIQIVGMRPSLCVCVCGSTPKLSLCATD